MIERMVYDGGGGDGVSGILGGKGGSLCVCCRID